MSNFISFCSSARILFSSDKQTNSTNKNKQHKTKVSKYIKRKRFQRKWRLLLKKKTQEISRINNSARRRLLIKLLSNVSHRQLLPGRRRRVECRRHGRRRYYDYDLLLLPLKINENLYFSYTF
ncbi:MAG: hypothetical protein ACI8RD_003232 [Bacillariaceae sp.]|jgi:hypothetical protein